jgi:hypothetical protein
MMEEQGIVGPADGAKPRQVLVRDVSEIFSSDDETEPVTVGQDDEDVYDDISDNESK